MFKRAAVGVLAVGALLLPGCASGGSSSSGAQTRTVQVDYRSDQFETSMFDYYPKTVTVRPGDTVEFKQAWTGEPHSVTMGTLIEPKLAPIVKLLKNIEKTGEFPPGEPKEFEEFNFPGPFEGDETAQNAAQPCYVDEATEYPGDVKTPCPQRPQPEFNGRQAIYSSGLIPYEGVKGNTFKMKIAEDATPGTYSYYCNVHFAVQYGQIVVAKKGSEIPSASEVAKTARIEAEKSTSVLLASWKAAKAGKPVKAGDPGMEQTIETKGKRLIGVPAPFFAENKFIHGSIQEFVPRDVTAKVGEKLTWTFTQGHTISFNVPSYFPVFTVAKDGTVEYNPKASKPVGWPGPPERPRGGGPDEGPPPEPVKIDAGEWDGKGFRSTGLDFGDGDQFSLTVTKAGVYPYACLIHPKMVGKLTVK